MPLVRGGSLNLQFVFALDTTRITATPTSQLLIGLANAGSLGKVGTRSSPRDPAVEALLELGSALLFIKGPRNEEKLIRVFNPKATEMKNTFLGQHRAEQFIDHFSVVTKNHVGYKYITALTTLAYCKRCCKKYRHPNRLEFQHCLLWPVSFIHRIGGQQEHGNFFAIRYPKSPQPGAC